MSVKGMYFLGWVCLWAVADMTPALADLNCMRFGVSFRPVLDNFTEQKYRESGMGVVAFRISAWDPITSTQLEDLRRYRGMGVRVILKIVEPYDDPERLGGRKTFLDRIYRNTRHNVKTINENAMEVWIYELSNELNAACLTTFPPYGWRRGSAWCDTDFRDGVLEALIRDVKEEIPSAMVSTNFHHFVSDPPFFTPEAYMRYWNELLDVIALSFYPNYLLPVPVLGWTVENKINTARSISGGKPVYISETSYDIGRPNDILDPLHILRTPRRQSEFIDQLADRAFSAGAEAVLWLSLQDNEPSPNIEGGWRWGFFSRPSEGSEPHREGEFIPWEHWKNKISEYQNPSACTGEKP